MVDLHLCRGRLDRGVDIEYYILQLMKADKHSFHALLRRMGQIERMERGRVCRLTGRPHYNHQTWHQGRNVVRYVPADQVERLQEAIDGYRLFMELARQYVDEIIQRTRRHALAARSPVKSRSIRRPRQKDV
jgi:hypothetical protein